MVQDRRMRPACLWQSIPLEQNPDRLHREISANAATPEEHWRAPANRCCRHGLIHFPPLRRCQKRLSARRQNVINENCHCLAFDHRVAHSICFIGGDAFVILLHVRRGRLVVVAIPFLQVNMLVLQCVRQLVRQYRFLLFRRNPIQQIHRLCFVIVIAGDLFAQQLDQNGLS